MSFSLCARGIQQLSSSVLYQLYPILTVISEQRVSAVFQNLIQIAWLLIFFSFFSWFSVTLLSLLIT